MLLLNNQINYYHFISIIIQIFCYKKLDNKSDQEQILKRSRVTYVQVDNIQTSILPPVILNTQDIKQFKKGVSIQYAKTFQNELKQKQLQKYEFYTFPILKKYKLCLTGFKSNNETKSMGAQILNITTKEDILNKIQDQNTFIIVYQPNLLIKLLDQLDTFQSSVLLQKVRSVRILDFLFLNISEEQHVESVFKAESYHLFVIENINVYNQNKMNNNYSLNFAYTSQNPEKHKFKSVLLQDLNNYFIVEQNLLLPKEYKQKDVLITNQALKQLALENVSYYKLKGIYQRPIIIIGSSYDKLQNIINLFGTKEQQQQFQQTFLFVPGQDQEQVKELNFKTIYIQDDNDVVDPSQQDLTIKNYFYFVTVYIEFLYKGVKQHQQIQESPLYYYIIDKTNRTLQNICNINSNQIMNIKQYGLKQANIIDLINECFNVNKLSNQITDKLIEILADYIGFKADVSCNNSLFTSDNSNTIFLFNSLAASGFNVSYLMKQKYQSQSENPTFQTTVKEESMSYDDTTDDTYDNDYYQPEQDAYFKLI